MAASKVLTPGDGDKPGGIADIGITPLALIIVFGIIATTLAQPQALGRLPLLFLLKERLHASKTEISTFFFWCGLFWYLKPFAGILTDAFPIFKTRRRWYLLISSVCAGAGWILLGLPGLRDFHDKTVAIPYTYGSLLFGCIFINLFMVMASTVVGAIIVEAGQRMSATGRLTSVRQLAFNFSGLVSGPLGGFLASGIFFKAAGVNSLLILSIFPIAFVFLRERPQAVLTHDAFANAGQQLATIFTSGTLWFALVFVFLFYFAPGFNTPLTFRQSDDLHFTKQQIGNLGVFGGAAGMLAAAVYGSVIRRISIRTLVTAGIFIAALGTLAYLFYNNYREAMLIESENGFCFGFAEVAIIDLAARATPKGCEGLGYSLLLSVRNIAGQGADVIGSRLSDAKWHFAWLVYLNAGTTAIVLILIPFMPRILMRRKDGDAPPMEVAPAGRPSVEE
jgi:MFS family permease